MSNHTDEWKSRLTCTVDTNGWHDAPWKFILFCNGWRLTPYTIKNLNIISIFFCSNCQPSTVDYPRLTCYQKCQVLLSTVCQPFVYDKIYINSTFYNMTTFSSTTWGTDCTYNRAKKVSTISKFACEYVIKYTDRAFCGPVPDVHAMITCYFFRRLL